MKTITLLALSLCLLVFGASAQTVSLADANFFGAGVSFNGTLAGTAIYARPVTTDTEAFGLVDAVAFTSKPLSVQLNFSAGIAQRVATIGNVKIFVPLAAGLSTVGSNTGWLWQSGLLGSIPIGTSNFRVQPNVRVLKASVGTG